MDTISQILKTLFLQASPLIQVISHGSHRAHAAELIAALALQCPFTIITASEWLPSYEVVRHLRRATPGVKEIFERIPLARAFTCYQLWDLIGPMAAGPEPLVIMDFFHAFCDIDVKLPVRMRILDQCVRRLDELTATRPIVVHVRQFEGEDQSLLQSMLSPVVDYRYELRDELEAGLQASLF